MTTFKKKFIEDLLCSNFKKVDPMAVWLIRSIQTRATQLASTFCAKLEEEDWHLRIKKHRKRFLVIAFEPKTLDISIKTRKVRRKTVRMSHINRDCVNRLEMIARVIYLARFFRHFWNFLCLSVCALTCARNTVAGYIRALLKALV